MDILKKLGGDRIAVLIAKVASGALLIGVLGSAIALFGQIVLARILGAEEYGWYVLYLALIQVLVVPSVCGFDSAVLRFTATYVATERWANLRGLISASRLIVLLISLVICLVALVVIETIDLDWTGARKSGVLVALILLPILSVTPVVEHSLRGLKKIVIASSVTNVARPSVLLLLVVTVYQTRSLELTATSAIQLNACAAVLSLLILVALVRRNMPAPVFENQREYEIKEWIGVSLPMVFMSGMYMLLAKVDILMIGSLLGAADAGIYAASSRIAEVVGFGLASVNSIAAPLLAEYFATRDFAKLQTTLTWSARIAGIVTLVAAVILWFFGDIPLMWFGGEFVVGHVVLRIVLFGILVSAATGSVGFMLVMGGEQIRAAQIVAGSVVLNILMNVFLIPRFGIVGAAISTAFCTTALNLTMFMTVRAKWGLNSSVFGRLRGEG